MVLRNCTVFCCVCCAVVLSRVLLCCVVLPLHCVELWLCLVVIFFLPVLCCSLVFDCLHTSCSYSFGSSQVRWGRWGPAREAAKCQVDAQMKPHSPGSLKDA